MNPRHNFNLKLLEENAQHALQDNGAVKKFLARIPIPQEVLTDGTTKQKVSVEQRKQSADLTDSSQHGRKSLPATLQRRW